MRPLKIWQIVLFLSVFFATLWIRALWEREPEPVWHPPVFVVVQTDAAGRASEACKNHIVAKGALAAHRKGKTGCCGDGDRVLIYDWGKMEVLEGAETATYEVRGSVDTLTGMEILS